MTTPAKPAEQTPRVTDDAPPARQTGEWPDFIAPTKYPNATEGWKDPSLPDFRAIWNIARMHGYAIGLHGSMKRDVDLIAVPWVEEADEPYELISALCEAFKAYQVGPVEQKPAGRIATTIQIDGYVRPIDLSIMDPHPLRAALDREAATIAKLAEREAELEKVNTACQRWLDDLSARILKAQADKAAAEAELKAAREALPVETAPKDGTWLLLALRGRYPNDAPMEVGHWGTYEMTNGREFTGWWVGGREYRDAEIESWLPLPAALSPPTKEKP